MEPTRHSPKAWLIPALAVVLVVGLVAALGGFDRRQVRWLTAEPGAEVDAGNLVFALESATVQFLAKATDQPWEVVVSGTVRNPHDRTLRPLTGPYGNLAGIDRAASPVVVAEEWTPGLGPSSPDTSYNRRQVVPPDDRPVRFTATFRFAEVASTDTFEVGVTPMEYTANTILGLNDEKQWNPDSFALPTSVTVPLTRLPDGDY